MRTKVHSRPLHLVVIALSICLATAPRPGVAASPDELVIALPANINTLDPAQTVTTETDGSVISNIYEPLIGRSADMKLVPAVASSWKAVADTMWQIELHAGRAFPNGEALDAQAVKWNIERILDPKKPTRIRAWFDAISEVRVSSATSLRIITSRPQPGLPAQLTMLYLLPPKWAAENNPSRLAHGSGPYELQEFVSGDRIVLVPNKQYRGPSKAMYKKLTYRPIPESSARVAAVINGEVDAATQLLASEIVQINASGKARAGSVEGPRGMFLKFNTLKGPFKDHPALRQAVNHAINKEEIINQLMGGGTSPSACQVPTPAYFGYNAALKPYSYSPETARELIAKSGYNRAVPIQLEVPLGRYQQAQEIAQAVAAQLEEVGLKVKIVEMEFGSWLNKMVKLRGLGDMALFGVSWPTMDATGLLTLFESSNAYAYWENSQFDANLKDAGQLLDPAKRKAALEKASEAMCKDAPVAFLWAQPIRYAVSSKVQWKPRSDEMTTAADFKPR